MKAMSPTEEHINTAVYRLRSCKSRVGPIRLSSQYHACAVWHLRPCLSRESASQKIWFGRFLPWSRQPVDSGLVPMPGPIHFTKMAGPSARMKYSADSGGQRVVVPITCNLSACAVPTTTFTANAGHHQSLVRIVRRVVYHLQNRLTWQKLWSVAHRTGKTIYPSKTCQSLHSNPTRSLFALAW